jgi:hypothetical protein
MPGVVFRDGNGVFFLRTPLARRNGDPNGTL